MTAIAENNCAQEYVGARVWCMVWYIYHQQIPLEGHIVFRGIFLETLCKSRGSANSLRDLRGSAGGLIYYCK